MTIRSGGRPRDPRDERRARSPQAHRYEPDAYATDYVPEAYEPSRRGGSGGGPGRRGRGSGGGLWGLAKFLVFALVLAGAVLLVLLTALRPLVNSAIVSWASDNPAALKIGFVAEVVKEDLGPALTEPASSDPAQIEFTVLEGDTAAAIGARLEGEGLLSDQRAFVFIAVQRGLTGDLQQGTFLIRKNLTPDEIVTSLLAPPEVPYVDIALRTSLRLEQVTAKLQTLDGLAMDPREFYELVTDPPASLLADYPWLRRALEDAPAGASLQGFLWPATYRVLPDTTPDELVRLMLDKFAAVVGDARMNVPDERGLTFYQVLTMASIVEREAQLDEEKPLIAGVYTNRLDGKRWPRQTLESDPTIFYVHDTLTLDGLDFAAWAEYVFWAPIEGGLTDAQLPPELAGYNTYVSKGLPPGPICTPTVTSIDAALTPDTKDGYLYFLAKGDGSGTTAFAKTFKEHQANIKKYLKPKP